MSAGGTELGKTLRRGRNSPRARLAVLLSGRGSNFLALHEAIERGDLGAELVVVLSNVDGAPGLEAAQRFGLATAVVDHRMAADRPAHEAQVLATLERYEAEWICLAGYMRLLSAEFVGRYPHRILNIHPSLLPSFPGLHVHEQVLQHGARVSGCTVHLVDAGLDSGPIVMQRAVDVQDDDDPQTLAARVLTAEHETYWRALRRLLEDPWRVQGRRIQFGPR